ncbi:MAG: radical SAM protein [bacterium]|nr:radical SAM protein [bacterium]
MKILFIQPSSLVSERWAARAVPYLPVGLGFLAAILRGQGHEVSIIDARTEGWETRGRLEGNWIEIGLTEEDIAARVRQFKPQIVGFSIPFTTQMPRLRSLARWIKAIHPEIFIICGGNHPTAAPQDVLSISEVDAVILGEGEATLAQLINRLESGLSFNQMDGIAFRSSEEQIQINPIKGYLQDLNQLPLPAYDLMPLKKYFKAVGGRCMPLFSSRGCDGTCAHCSSHHLFGRVNRRFSPQYLTKQIRHLVEYYGVREFTFDDDALFADKEAAENLFGRLISENLKIQWSARSGKQYGVLDEEILQVIKLAGARRLYYAPESGSRRVLRRILKKTSDLFALEQAVLRTLKAGIKVSCDFTIGFPSETIEEIYETLNYAWKLRSLGIDEFSFSLATPYVGTNLRNLSEQTGYLLSVPDPMFTPHDTCLPTDEFASDEIINIRDTAEREFNSRGLIIGIPRRTNYTKRSAFIPEERHFFTVAPQSSLLNVISAHPVSQAAAKEVA